MLRLLLVGEMEAAIRIGLDRLNERRAVELRETAAGDVELAVEVWTPDILLVAAGAGAAGGPEALRHWRHQLPDADTVVVRAGETDVKTADWLRAGAFAVVGRPVEPDELVEELERAAERVRLRVENRQLRRQLEAPRRFPAIVGQSKKMLELYELVGAVAGSDANILVLGDNGTGKELIANAVHAHSARAEGPFIKINCAALPKELIEAELFGYRRAFTGAFTDKAGLLAMAEGGSLLLDEIGEMPSYLQAKLLRILQEREFRPIGSDRSVRVDFRLICATNVDVEAALREGRLREDLYFRINTITVRVPALRERLEDVAPLCQHFLALYNGRHGRTLGGVSPAAYQRLMQHRWPGNIRELENIIERGVLVARGPDLQPEDLPDSVVTSAAGGPIAPDLLPATATLAEIERMAILQALQRTNWNKQDAAQQLGLYRPTLYSKMKKHGITSPPRVRRRLAVESPSESPA